MKYADEGFAHGKLDLRPEKATTSVFPFALVAPAGNVIVVEFPNKTTSAATYRSKQSAQEALGKAREDVPGVMIWDRRHP